MISTQQYTSVFAPHAKAEDTNNQGLINIYTADTWLKNERGEFLDPEGNLISKSYLSDDGNLYTESVTSNNGSYISDNYQSYIEITDLAGLDLEFTF
jgi:hypothetical protein